MECLICGDSWFLENGDNSSSSQLSTDAAIYLCKLLGLSSPPAIDKTKSCNFCGGCIEKVIQLKFSMQLLESLENQISCCKDELIQKLVRSNARNSIRIGVETESEMTGNELTRNWRLDLLQELALIPYSLFGNDLVSVANNFMTIGVEVIIGDKPKPAQRPRPVKDQATREFEARVGKELVIKLDRLSPSFIESVTGKKFPSRKRAPPKRIEESLIRRGVNGEILSIQCPCCPKIFATRNSYYQHQLIHKTEREMKYFCKVCGKGFFHPSTLTIHEAVHRKKERFECKICERSFSNTWGLRRHAMNGCPKDTSSQAGKVQPSGSGQQASSNITIQGKSRPDKHSSSTFTSGPQPVDLTEIDMKNNDFDPDATERVVLGRRNQNKIHPAVSKPGQVTTTECPRLRCKHCGLEFKSNPLMVAHFLESAECNQKEVDPFEAESKGSETSEELSVIEFPCPFCGVSFLTPEKLEVHLNTHRREESKTAPKDACLTSKVLTAS